MRGSLRANPSEESGPDKNVLISVTSGEEAHSVRVQKEVAPLPTQAFYHLFEYVSGTKDVIRLVNPTDQAITVTFSDDNCPGMSPYQQCNYEIAGERYTDIFTNSQRYYMESVTYGSQVHHYDRHVIDAHAGAMACALWQCSEDQCDMDFDNCHTPMLQGGFTATTPLPLAVASASAVLLNPYEVLVTGGYQQNGEVTANTAIFNLHDKTWYPAKSLYMPRSNAGALKLADGRVLVTGGYYNYQDNKLTLTTEIYGLSSDTWHETDNMVHPQHDNSLYQLSDDTVLSLGGQGTTADYHFYIERYDPTTGQWSSDAGSLDNGGIARTIVKLSDGNFLVAGGINQSGFISSSAIYHPDTHSWSPAADMPYSTAGTVGILLSAGSDANKVLLAGGIRPGSETALKTVIYDPATNTWKQGNATSSKHPFTHAATLAGGYVLLAGGYNEDETTTPLAEFYNPYTQKWTRTSNYLLGEYAQFNMVPLPDNKLLLLGGMRMSELNKTVFNDVSLFQSNGSQLK